MPVVTTFEAIESGTSWTGLDVTNRPTFITFSFEATPALYLNGLQSQAFLATFQALAEADRAIARQALQAWADVSGITFFEVPAGQGDIRFGNYDFSSRPDLDDVAGFAYYPLVFSGEDGAFEFSNGGDIFIDKAQTGFDLYAHEIGHALGLKHPFDDEDEGLPTLDKSVDNLAHTVMTYNFEGSPANKLGTLDVQAIQHMYGLNSADGTQVATWSWNAATFTLTQGGDSTSNTIFGVGTSDRITGGEGDDFVFSRSGDDTLSGENGDDTLTGGIGSDSLDGGAGADYLNGDAGTDTISGGAGDDLIDGGGGGDSLTGGGGNDVFYAYGDATVDGGDGIDQLWFLLAPGSPGATLTYSRFTSAGGSYSNIEGFGLWGDVGNDTIIGGSRTDLLICDAGDDSITAGTEDDALWGDSGADTLSAGDGDDYLEGGAGDDLLLPGAGSDYIDGGAGIDTVDYSSELEVVNVTINQARTAGGAREVMVGVENLIGTAYGDTLRGDAAGNQLYGRAGNDSISGGGGANYLRGDEGNDTLVGGADFDDINGNMGDDTASGGDGDDWVVGGKDNDRLNGDAGADLVYGNLGADTLDGGAGNDVVRGGQDNDVLTGGAGDDYVSGDKGDDTLSGGTGADRFHSFGDAGIDKVLDFSRTDGDRVQLDPGTTYTLAQVGADTVISMAGGGQMILVGVSLTSLTGDWIFVG